jgi:hypothetical protein
MEAQLFQAKMTEIDPPPDRATGYKYLEILTAGRSTS